MYDYENNNNNKKHKKRTNYKCLYVPTTTTNAAEPSAIATITEVPSSTPPDCCNHGDKVSVTVLFMKTPPSSRVVLTFIFVCVLIVKLFESVAMVTFNPVSVFDTLLADMPLHLKKESMFLLTVKFGLRCGCSTLTRFLYCTLTTS